MLCESQLNTNRNAISKAVFSAILVLLLHVCIYVRKSSFLRFGSVNSIPPPFAQVSDSARQKYQATRARSDDSGMRQVQIPNKLILGVLRGPKKHEKLPMVPFFH